MFHRKASLSVIPERILLKSVLVSQVSEASCNFADLSLFQNTKLSITYMLVSLVAHGFIPVGAIVSADLFGRINKDGDDDDDDDDDDDVDDILGLHGCTYRHAVLQSLPNV